jgi:hypothetical protein
MTFAHVLGSTGGGARLTAVGQLLAVDVVTNRVQVSIGGGPAVWLPMLGSAYDGVTTVAVLLDPQSGPLVLGPMGIQAEPPPPPAPAPDPGTPQTVSDTAVIRPSWSGTYRSIRGAWDRWNTDRYGGRSTLWQGDAFGSGPLTGLATYGSQVVNLRALSISRVTVTVVHAYGEGSVTVQGSVHGSKPSGAPSSSGSTASGVSTISLPSDVREGMRTGSVRGLALVGGSYQGVRGTSHPSGMALSITYTRAA